MGLSKIQWTDYTFNPWLGCRKVSPECANCYAETLDRNRYSKTLAPGTKANPVSHWGSGPRHRTKTWGDPLKWNKSAGRYPDACTAGHRLCAKAQESIGNKRCPSKHGPDGKYDPSIPECGAEIIRNVRPRVFCASLSDWLDDENVPVEWLADLLRVIACTPNLDWLMLSKRPQNWEPRLRAAAVHLQTCQTGHVNDPAWRLIHSWIPWNRLPGEPPENVWIGVSAGADQSAALAIPAKVHFLSCEPMLRPLDTTHAAKFDWVILGGESGPKARPCNVDWIRDALAFCRENNVAPFVKQFGSVCFTDEPDEDGWPDGVTFDRNCTTRALLKDSHGGDPAEWPEDLRVREFPTGLEIIT